MNVRKKKKKRNLDNLFLNKAVKRFKKGKSYYFDVIYTISVKRLELYARRVDFSRLKYDINDFVQEGILFVFDYLIDAYDPKRGSKFSTLFFREMKQFVIRFMRDSKRKEILIESDYKTDDSVNEELERRDEKIWSGFSYNELPEGKLILKEDIKQLYLLLTKREKKIFRMLYKKRHTIGGYDSKLIMAYQCGLKYKQFKDTMNSIEEKYRGMIYERV